MAAGKLDMSSWDRRILRLSLCVLLALSAGCTSTPPVEEPLPRLKDRTADSDYDLSAVANKLRQAERIEYDGNREAAILVVDTAQGMLPKEHQREHDYLEVVKAGMWAREGERRDAARAVSLLEAVTDRARLREDDRLLADVKLVHVVLALARADRSAAATAGHESLALLASVDAHRKKAETATELAYQFIEVDPAAAGSFAREAVSTAERLQDDEALIGAQIASAHVAFEISGKPDTHFLGAYEAAYRLNDLGWRNVVISQAVNAWYVRDDYEAVRRWGDRLRSDEMGSLGDLPRLEDTGLWEGDYVTLLAQYAFAVEDVAPGSNRAREAAGLAVEMIEQMPEEDQQGWIELAEKLRNGLLQEPAKK